MTTDKEVTFVIRLRCSSSEGEPVFEQIEAVIERMLDAGIIQDSVTNEVDGDFEVRSALLEKE